MKIVISDAEVVFPGHGLHGKKKNILIENGIIRQITSDKLTASKIISKPGLKVSPGWVDLNVFVGDPGYEHKEDFTTINAAASSGGFTGIAIIPNTRPVVQTKDVVSYLKNKSNHYLIDVFPYAALSNQNKGEELTEMIDLFEAGAVGFTDGDNSVWHSDLLLKALQYNQKFNGIVLQRPEDRLLAAFGQMNEGKTSTILGLKGIPALAEELVVQRDLKILEYAGGRLHFSLISTPGALQLIKEAKKKGLNVTCDVAFYNLALTDVELTGFDTNYKVNPPLRTKKDVEYLVKSVKDGTIDAIVSAHRPQDSESKNLEFDHADFGMIGLETVFPVINTFTKDLSSETVVEKLAVAPRKILNLPLPVIEEGKEANLTVFDTDTEWIYEKKNIKSKSLNTPFAGTTFKGKVWAVFNKKNYFLSE